MEVLTDMVQGLILTKYYEMDLDARKPVFGSLHPHRLISAVVICFLESIISKLATSEISIF